MQDILLSVLTQYHRTYDLTQVPIKIDLLRPMIEERGFVDKIVWEKYEFDAVNIAAQVTFYKAEMGVYGGTGDYARIQYSHSLNFCWERFVICKEMYHCILDKDSKDRVSNIDELLKLSEYLAGDAVSNLEPFDPYKTEQNAEILALETLFPLELREHHLADYRSKKITDYQLALRYRIPEKYTRQAMYPAYLAAAQRLRADKRVAL